MMREHVAIRRRRQGDLRTTAGLPGYTVKVGRGETRTYKTFWPALRYFLLCRLRQAMPWFNRRKEG